MLQSSRPFMLLRTVCSRSYSMNAKTDVSAFMDKTVCNAPENILSKVGRNLHTVPGHPLHTIAQRIVQQFPVSASEPLGVGESFKYFDRLSPVVSTADNFDKLLFPLDHVGRSFSDTYYLSKSHLLRTHTSAHQVPLMCAGHRNFLVAGDVYRRDEINATHYPVFHQMEGVQLFDESQLPASLMSDSSLRYIEESLKSTLEGVFRAVYGNVEFRWVDAYFPFTSPSWEMEVLWNGTWLEVLGCGVVHQGILNANGLGDRRGWAFGLGLDRIAMLLCKIPDIRLFWTEDARFHNQFMRSPGKIVEFTPYSKYPECPKDITFWLPHGYNSNDFYELVREIAGDLVENVELIDQFVHPKTNRGSHCYRIHYRSMDRSLTNEEINSLQERVRTSVQKELGAELR